MEGTEQIDVVKTLLELYKTRLELLKETEGTEAYHDKINLAIEEIPFSITAMVKNSFNKLTEIQKKAFVASANMAHDFWNTTYKTYEDDPGQYVPMAIHMPFLYIEYMKLVKEL